jgi:hypothetical protein
MLEFSVPKDPSHLKTVVRVEYRRNNIAETDAKKLANTNDNRAGAQSNPKAI